MVRQAHQERKSLPERTVRPEPVEGPGLTLFEVSGEAGTEIPPRKDRSPSACRRAGVFNIIMALVIVFAPSAIRTVRAQALAVKEMDYVLAARAIGAHDTRIVLRYLVPNIFALFIILSTLQLGNAIIAEASLSFLGVGVPADVPTWGSMLADANIDIQRTIWPSIFPGAALCLAVFSVNLLGEAMRDVLDPRLRGTD